MSDGAQPAGFWANWFARDTVVRALKVSAIVGTALVAINQGDRILAGDSPPAWKVLLTYFVPYAVSSFSGAAAKSGR